MKEVWSYQINRILVSTCNDGNTVETTNDEKPIGREWRPPCSMEFTMNECTKLYLQYESTCISNTRWDTMLSIIQVNHMQCSLFSGPAMIEQYGGPPLSWAGTDQNMGQYNMYWPINQPYQSRPCHVCNLSFLTDISEYTDKQIGVSTNTP